MFDIGHEITRDTQELLESRESIKRELRLHSRVDLEEMVVTLKQEIERLKRAVDMGGHCG